MPHIAGQCVLLREEWQEEGAIWFSFV